MHLNGDLNEKRSLCRSRTENSTYKGRSREKGRGRGLDHTDHRGPCWRRLGFKLQGRDLIHIVKRSSSCIEEKGGGEVRRKAGSLSGGTAVTQAGDDRGRSGGGELASGRMCFGGTDGKI